jgi:hypothetical protein
MSVPNKYVDVSLGKPFPFYSKLFAKKRVEFIE